MKRRPFPKGTAGTASLTSVTMTNSAVNTQQPN